MSTTRTLDPIRIPGYLRNTSIPGMGFGELSQIGLNLFNQNNQGNGFNAGTAISPLNPITPNTGFGARTTPLGFSTNANVNPQGGDGGGLQSLLGSLTDKQQKDILNLYQKLDNNGLLHNDANPLNLMIKGNEWKLIDYVFFKKITKKHGQYPNLNISLNLLLNSMNGLITRKYLIESPLILLNALENKCY